MARGIRQIVIVLGPAVVALLWLRHELAHPVALMRMDLHAPVTSLTLLPARYYLAYSAFLVAGALVPALYLLDIRLFERSRRLSPRAFVALLAVFLALPSALAGYLLEPMASRFVLTSQALRYERGGQHVDVPWRALQSMALRRGPRSLALELAAGGRTVTADLSPFGPAERRVLTHEAQALAGLTVVRQSDHEIIWRRWGGDRRIAPRDRQPLGPDAPLPTGPGRPGSIYVAPER